MARERRLEQKHDRNKWRKTLQAKNQKKNANCMGSGRRERVREKEEQVGEHKCAKQLS